MTIAQKTVDIEITQRRKDGGDIVISTGRPDRDRDRVLPRGGRLDNYLRNPVVQWGHNYYEPWATIGRTESIEVSDAGLAANFTLREAASDTDPQHIILYLWQENFIRTASIGFRPEEYTANDLGGLDFTVWELLEWSLVPIPANTDALRLAAKRYPAAWDVLKRGRVLSAKNEGRIRTAHDALSEVLGELADDEEDGKQPTLTDLVTRFDRLEQLVKTLGTPAVEPPAPPPAIEDVTPLMTALRGLRAALPTKE